MARLDVLELQLLFVQHGGFAGALEFPGGDVAVVLVVALGFAVFLVFLAEVAAAGFLAVERVEGGQFGEVDEIGDAAGAFEDLIDVALIAGDADVLPELVAQQWNFLEQFFEARVGAEPFTTAFYLGRTRVLCWKPRAVRRTMSIAFGLVSRFNWRLLPTGWLGCRIFACFGLRDDLPPQGAGGMLNGMMK